MLKGGSFNKSGALKQNFSTAPSVEGINTHTVEGDTNDVMGSERIKIGEYRQ